MALGRTGGVTGGLATRQRASDRATKDVAIRRDKQTADRNRRRLNLTMAIRASEWSTTEVSKEQHD